MIHMSSHSYFVDLKVTNNFGEIGFFTDNPRLITAKSRDYCELYCVHKRDFLKVAENHIHGIVIFLFFTNINYIVSISHDKNSFIRGVELLCY